MALAAHEIAHHFGYDEADATLLQRYFLEEIMTDKSFSRNAIKNFVHLVFQLAKESLETTTCENTTNLQNEFVNLKQTVSGIGYNRGLQHPEFYKAFTETKITPLQAESRNILKSACQGDSSKARNALVLLIEQLNKLNESIIEELFPRQL